jgi:hypothetical protein
MREMCVMDLTGDTRITWDAHNTAEVDNAREQFKTWKAKGYLAYSVKPNGEPDRQLLEFDPNAQKIIFSPPLRGG